MGKFLDALMNKPAATATSNVVPKAATGQPVPVAFVTEPPSDLTSGSDLTQAAQGAWPTLLDGNNKYMGGWVRSVLKEVSNRNILGNYGAGSSRANFGFRFHAFEGIGGYPGTGNVPGRPTYNTLVPITYNQRVTNANITGTTTEEHGSPSIQTRSSTWNGSSTASLNKTGEVLL